MVRIRKNSSGELLREGEDLVDLNALDTSRGNIFAAEEISISKVCFVISISKSLMTFHRSKCLLTTLAVASSHWDDWAAYIYL